MFQRRRGQTRRRPRQRTRRLLLEMLEGRSLLAGFTMSAYEQVVVEMINRARLDPAAEAARLGIDLNEGLTPGTISATPKQPLAPHQALATAARAHSQDMIDRDFFSHTNPSGQGPRERMVAAGYTPRAWGENIIDGCGDEACVHDYLFLSPGHRTNILKDNFREVGVGLAFASETWITGTENFGSRDGNAFLTGVVFSDHRVGDNFLNVGESLANVTVTARRTGTSTTYTTTTGPSGGYALQVPAGTYDMQAEGGELGQVLSVPGVQIGASNVKVDFVVPHVPPPVDSFEPNNTLATATVLGYGDQLLEHLTIHDPSDDDYFLWTAHESGVLTVELDLRRGWGRPSLQVLDTTGKVLQYGSWAEDAQLVSAALRVEAGKPYVIWVSPWDDAGNVHRDYDLKLDGPGVTMPPPDAFEPNDDFATAVNLGAGDRTLTGLTTHAPSDRDVFRWTAAASGAATFRATLSAAAENFQLFLYDAQERLLGQSQETGLERTVSTQVAAGDQLFVVAQAGSRTLVAAYTLEFDGVMPPVAGEDQAMTTPAAAVTIDLLGNDHADDGRIDPASVRWTTLPQHGRLGAGSADGTFVYTPDAGFLGVDRFAYVVADDLGNESAPASVRITVLDPANKPWQNPRDPRDVNSDMSISPIDALQVINRLNRGGWAPLGVPSPSTDFPLPYYDVSGDDYISPLDALQIINFLNDVRAGEGENDLVMTAWPGGGASSGAPRLEVPAPPERPAWPISAAAPIWQDDAPFVGSEPFTPELSGRTPATNEVPTVPDAADEDETAIPLESATAGEQDRVLVASRRHSVTRPGRSLLSDP